MTWILTVTLWFAWGMPDEFVTLIPGEPLQAREECLAMGTALVQWLSADGVQVTFTCQQQEAA